MVRAYVLIETETNETSWAQDQAGALGGLTNCLGLYSRLWPNEIVLHLDCDDGEVLNQAIARDLPQLEGVTRVTVCMVMKS